MNPLMSVVDMVPDDDLNTRLKFYVSLSRLKVLCKLIWTKDLPKFI